MRFAAPLLLLGGALLGCAKVGPPAGGPVDRTPPSILAHTPAADATGVPIDAQVELVFSEAMDRSRTEAALFVAPSSPVERRWRGRRLQLRFLQGLHSGRTYVVTVGTGARDLRGNSLPQSFTLAFATGAQLNQGRIRGRVFNHHQPTSAAHVWAYDLGHFRGGLFTDPPDYRTQSGSDGGYEFSRLSAGRYRLVAFADENADLRWDAGEPLALPAGELEVEEGRPALTGDLDLFPQGAPAPRLQRVHPLNQHRLLLQFDRAVAPQQLEMALQGLAIEGVYQLPHEPSKIYAQTAPQEPGRAYSFASLKVAGQPVSWREPVRGSGRPDQTPPSLSRQRPERGAALVPEDSLALIFTEAMEPAVLRDIWVQSDTSQAPEGHWEWTGPATLVFVPALPWPPGAYRLQGRTAGLRDLSGLPLPDSLLSFAFEVLDRQATGRIAGRALDRADAPVQAWVAAQSPERSYRVQADAEGRYLLEGLLPGAYRVFAFVDLNLNQQQDRGSSEPFTPSEPYACNPEAVALSPGSAAEGIDLHFSIP